MTARQEPGGTGLLYGLYQARLRRQLQGAELPHHVAMIIDGNRRWARERALETAAHGHRAGAEKMREFLGWCDQLGIRVVTIYLLSTDNLTGRSSEELDPLFEIIADLADDLSRAADWRIQHVGTSEGLPEPLTAVLRAAEDRTAGNVGLHVNRGETLGLIGESGSGKSTLARIVAGLLPPSAGSITIDGQPLGALPRKQLRRGVQLVFQDHGSALNPRVRIGEQLIRPMVRLGVRRRGRSLRRLRPVVVSTS